MLQKSIKNIVKGEDLTPEMMEGAMQKIMNGEAKESEISAFMVGLRMKGEKSHEIAAAARIIRQFASPVEYAINEDDILADTCGTGGDMSHTFNVSTAVSFIISALGIKMAKHGNRSVSSECGSADCLEALGVNINLDPPEVTRCLKEIGIAFFFAPKFHHAMRFAAPVRNALGIRSIFNILGPICNPAPVNAQLLGVYVPSLTEIMANALKELGCKYAMVVHGHGGLDEVSLSGPTKASWLVDNEIKNIIITPEDLGVETSSIDMLTGGDAKTNAEIVKSILMGERKGPRKDMVLINAALLLYACKKTDTLKQGVLMAQEAIDSGAALEKLIELIRFSNILGKEDA